MNRKDKLLVAFFGVTAFAGFAGGIHHVAHHAKHHHHRRAELERRVARVCVEAARDLDREGTRAAQGAPRPTPSPDARSGRPAARE
ncbi:MAG: hypothetical protein AAGH15_24130 [Myxococcota bacterium]